MLQELREPEKRGPIDLAALVDGAKEKGENLLEKAPCFLRYPDLARSMPSWGTPESDEGEQPHGPFPFGILVGREGIEPSTY